MPDIRIDADRLSFDLPRASCLPEIYTCVDSLRIPCRHLPERILDNDRGVEADTKLEKEDFLPRAGTQKVFVSLGGPMPALILYKRIIATEVHTHRPPAARTTGHKMRRNGHL